MDVQPRFDYGDAVRVVRTLRNDGTFPGLDVGIVLVREGSIGHVRNVGTFLQDQIIYAVHFFDVDRTVGCREEELIPRTEAWVPTKFLFGDKAKTRIPLGIRGQVVVPAEMTGEIIKVFRHRPGGPGYHVLFDGLMFEIRETALLPIEVEAEVGYAP